MKPSSDALPRHGLPWMRRSFQRLRIFRAALLPAPGDMPETRARVHERERRAALTVLTAVVARATAIAVNLLLVPITLSYLGEERFGLWMTVTAFTQMLSFADLGLGNGLMNSISEGYGRDDRAAVRSAVSNAFAMLCGIAAVICVGVLLAYPLLDWSALLKLKSQRGIADAGPAALVVLLSLVATIPLGVVQRIQSGIQEAYETNIFVMIGKACSLLAIFVGIQLQVGLTTLLIVFMGVPVLATALNGFRVFWQRHRDLFPSWSDVSRPAASKLLRLGLQFMLLQACVALIFSSDNIILAHEAGASQVASYSVVDQLFALPIMLLTVATGPLWPAYTEALARRDHQWILSTFRKSFFYACLFTLASSVALVLAAPLILRVWTRELASPSLSLLLGMGVWNICLGVLTPVAMFLNAIGALRVQVVASIGMLALGTVVRVLACRHFAGPGLAWGTSASYFAIAVVPILIEARRHLSEVRRSSMQSATEQPLPGPLPC